MKRSSRALSPDLQARAEREALLIALPMLSECWRTGAMTIPTRTALREAALLRASVAGIPVPMRLRFLQAVEIVASRTLASARPLFDLARQQTHRRPEHVSPGQEHELRA